MNRTKLTDAQLERMFRVQEYIDDIIRDKDCDDYTEYDSKLSAISAAIDDFYENCIME